MPDEIPLVPPDPPKLPQLPARPLEYRRPQRPAVSPGRQALKILGWTLLTIVLIVVVGVGVFFGACALMR